MWRGASTVHMVNTFQSAGIGLADLKTVLQALDRGSPKTCQVAAGKASAAAKAVLSE